MQYAHRTVFNLHDESFQLVAVIPIFQMRKLMPRKVEFLAQEEAVAGPKPRSV